MPFTSTVTATDPYEGACPTGIPFVDVVLNILNNFTSVDVADSSPGSGVTFVRQSNTPTPANGLFWKRINNDIVTPKPMGEYVSYNGRWVPSNPPAIGTIANWTGDPTGLFDTDGKGLFTPSPDTPYIAGPWYGWQICNGNNGSRNLKNAFVIAAEKWDGTIPNWVASIPQQDGSNQYQVSGGRSGIVLDDTWLPNIPVREYDSGGAASYTALYGGNKFSATTDGSANPRTGQVAQVEIKDNYPLFRAVPYLQFMGYGS